MALVKGEAEKNIPKPSTAAPRGLELPKPGMGAGGNIRAAILSLPDGRKYVKADRMVVFGNDPEEWRDQVENYINRKIRKGEDVQLVAEDGDVFTLTGTSAEKLASKYEGEKALPEDIYEVKANAAVHIDEIVRISSKSGWSNDEGGVHGDFAKDGFLYRKAFFEDFDGKYYRLTISVPIGNEGKVVYSIGNIRERSNPAARNASSGSSGSADAHAEIASSNNNIPASSEKNNPQNSAAPRGLELAKPGMGAGGNFRAALSDDEEPRKRLTLPSAAGKTESGDRGLSYAGAQRHDREAFTGTPALDKKEAKRWLGGRGPIPR